jgi:hypothetical protein
LIAFLVCDGDWRWFDAWHGRSSDCDAESLPY